MSDYIPPGIFLPDCRWMPCCDAQASANHELDPPIQCKWDIIDSLNGLVCLHDYREDIIVLWNPSLRKSLTLLKPRVSSYMHTVGFGFIPTSHECKIVRFSNCHVEIDGFECEADIYELGTGSWRDLKLGDNVNFSVYSQQAHLKGILYWYARNLEKVNPAFSNFILTFDLKNEKSRALMFPSCLRHDVNILFKPSTFRESLCLIEKSRDNLCKIWVMKEPGVADSWEKLFNIDTEQHGLTYNPKFRHNEELLFGKSYHKTHIVKTELLSYDFDKNQVKNLGVLAYTPRIGPAFSINTYLDSLVLIKGSDEVKIDEKSNQDF